ncbi:zinc carboxypeptidase [Apiospora hydei]|uniref:Zinc carboxypeptidase n=1 Tax=Apiospora hydei TaxID=1337664 RepID=A0ABR1VYP4_9PEZI
MKLSKVLGTGGFMPLVSACLLPGEETGDGRHHLYRRQENGDTGFPIGSGDRFEGGAKFPRGLGTQEPGTKLDSLLSVEEIESAMRGLVSEYDIETFTMPYTTFENRTMLGGKVGGSGNCSEAYHVYFNGAIHARERGSPDNLLYFISDLLYANKTRTGLTYGGRSYSASDVSRALAAGIVFVPLSNPDGVAYDQAQGNCWRKNRNPASATPGNDRSVGIDLNRNFDFLWDFPTKFEPTVAPNVAAFSEPETRNIKWVMDSFPSIRWYHDLHSFAGVVLYSWGSDENQAREPGMNFLNSTCDAVRGLMPDDPSGGIVYGEYTPSKDWSENVYAAMRTGNAMDAATGRHYEVQQAAYLYPTSGASDDYSYSRHFADPGLNLIHGFTVEFGFGNENASCPFYPTAEQYHLNMLETGAGYMEFLMASTEIGLGDEVACSS